jgi:hypothetical protein
MKRIILVMIMGIGLFLGCTAREQARPLEKEIKQQENIEKSEPLKPVLAAVEKMEIPRIERKSNRVKVLIWGKRPENRYSREEVKITPMETGYAVEVWLYPEKDTAGSLDFYKEVSFTIPDPGGYDIELRGRNRSIVKLIFIDDNYSRN